MSGTDSTRESLKGPSPIIVLVEPQLGENIGMCARAMGNFALHRLRIVKPRDGWPNLHARRAAAGADHIIEAVELFDSVEAALADCTLVFATTARPHDQAKPVLGPDAAAQEMAAGIAQGDNVAILFGRERWGLTNEEVARADRIVTYPVDPSFASLNLAQAVLLLGYEWFRHAHRAALPFERTQHSPRASKQQFDVFFDNLVQQLDRVEFLRPAEKRETMIVNLRNIVTRMEPTQQDIRTLHGVVRALAEGNKGPATGGVLNSSEAGQLRALLAARAEETTMPGEQGPVRGLARLLRRNTSEAERKLWRALTRDRRFAGQFKRQTPVGRMIPDFVSFPLRLAIELVMADEDAAVVADRTERRAWLQARNYRVVEVLGSRIENALDDVLDELASKIG